MFFEDKLGEIREKINQISSTDKVVVWGTGKHTDELLKHTALLQIEDLTFVDNHNCGKMYFGFTIQSPNEIKWEDVKCVVISSYKFQADIMQQVQSIVRYNGKICSLYHDADRREFYFLYKRDDGRIRFSGEYKSWEEAAKDCTGYDQDNIIEKVYEATRTVIEGNGAYERDSVVFTEQQYLFHIISLVAMIAEHKDTVCVVDFGGALGSVYWQNRKFLRKFKNTAVKWIVVEQEKFVSKGKSCLENGEIFFESQIEDIHGKPDIVIASGVLQYLPDYKDALRSLQKLSSQYLVIDRTVYGKREKICKQEVPPSIYEGSYPMRIINREEVLELLKEDFELVTEYASVADPYTIDIDGEECFYKGMILQRKCGKA